MNLDLNQNLVNFGSAVAVAGTAVEAGTVATEIEDCSADWQKTLKSDFVVCRCLDSEEQTDSTEARSPF